MKKSYFILAASFLLMLCACKKEFTITVTSNNEAWGSVKGGGTFAKGTEIELKATPNIGYKFVQWNDGETKLIRKITVEKNETYTATFAEIKNYTVTVTSNNEEWGTASGGGVYQEGTIISIEATPKSGCYFKGWGDGNIENPRTITVSGNADYVANFTQIEVFTLNVSSNNEEWGTVTGGGIYEENTVVELKATPKTNCFFIKWSDDDTNTTRSITVTANATYVATFAQKEMFTITLKSNNESWGTVSGGGMYEKNTTIEIKATPALGCRFVQWNDGNTNATRTITVTANATYTATFSGEYYFSVSATKKILFSPGNLQWSATNGGSTPTTHTVAGGGTAEGTWRFAPHQWDTIGADNKNISATYTGWIDLFGWGTSGFGWGTSVYSTYPPYMTSTNDYHYPDMATLYYVLEGTFEWGQYNAIYNTRTQTTDVPGTWRTLTYDEWDYLLFRRDYNYPLDWEVRVNGILGRIILPDNWDRSIYTFNTGGTTIIGAEDWIKLENAGAVFLPAAGSRSGTTIVAVGSLSCYWTATQAQGTNDWRPAYLISQWSPTTSNRSGGCSVRLVRDVE